MMEGGGGGEGGEGGKGGGGGEGGGRRQKGCSITTNCVYYHPISRVFKQEWIRKRSNGIRRGQIYVVSTNFTTFKFTKGAVRSLSTRVVIFSQTEVELAVTLAIADITGIAYIAVNVQAVRIYVRQKPHLEYVVTSHKHLQRYKIKYCPACMTGARTRSTCACMFTMHCILTVVEKRKVTKNIIILSMPTRTRHQLAAAAYERFVHLLVGIRDSCSSTFIMCRGMWAETNFIYRTSSWV